MWFSLISDFQSPKAASCLLQIPQLMVLCWGTQNKEEKPKSASLWTCIHQNQVCSPENTGLVQFLYLSWSALTLVVGLVCADHRSTRGNFLNCSLPYFSEAGYLIEPGAHRFSSTGCQWAPEILHFGLLMSAGNLHSWPLVCEASTLPTELSPQPHHSPLIFT